MREEVEINPDTDFLPDQNVLGPQYNVDWQKLRDICKMERDANGAELPNDGASDFLLKKARDDRTYGETRRFRADAPNKGVMDDAPMSGSYQVDDTYVQESVQRYGETKEDDAKINHTTKTASVGKGRLNGVCTRIAVDMSVTAPPRNKTGVIQGAALDTKKCTVSQKQEQHVRNAMSRDAVINKYRTDQATVLSVANKHNVREVQKHLPDPQIMVSKPVLYDRQQVGIVSDSSMTPYKNRTGGDVKKSADVPLVNDGLKKDAVKVVDPTEHIATTVQKKGMHFGISDHNPQMQG